MASAVEKKSAMDTMFNPDDLNSTIDESAGMSDQGSPVADAGGGAGAGAGAGGSESHALVTIDESKSTNTADASGDSANKEEESGPVPKGKIERGLTGLRNQGNTCFMNTFIQCMGQSKFLVCFFLSGLHIPILKENLKKKAAKNGKELSEEELKKEVEGSVSYRTGNLIYGLWEKNRKIRPTLFRKHLMKHRSSMNNWRQHDTEEALTLFFEHIHDELKTNQSICFPTPPAEVLEVRDTLSHYAALIESADTDEQKKAYKEEYNKYRDNNIDMFTVFSSYERWKEMLTNEYSIITDVFTGMTISTVQCQSCHYKSNTFELSNRLSVGLDESKTKESVYDCIARYFKAENIPKADDSWKCSSCKERVEISKGMRLWEPPCVLIIQLKRFEYTMTGKARKIKSSIDFPIRGLDISQTLAKENVFYKNSSLKYNLYAVANHSGGVSGGHYYAYCRNMLEDKWYEYNDIHVIRMRESEIVTPEAYILFYIREDKDNFPKME
jgi:ubiquitin carboxyl-terminal hydrolase 8